MRARAGPPPAPLRVHIDTLSLPAMPHARGERVGAALLAELTRLMSQQAAQQRLREITGSGRLSSAAAVDAGMLPLAPGERPELTGHRLAERVAGGLLAPDRGERR